MNSKLLSLSKPTKKLYFELYNDPEHCYPGSAMAGQVILETTKPLQCQKITLQPIGETKIFFFCSIDHGRSRGFSNSERYFNESQIIYEPEMPDTKLPPGKHLFPFRFVFPENCLPSFIDPKGKGKVKYEIIATAHIRRGWNLKVKHPLTVCPLVDFNDLPELLKPVELKTHNTDLEVIAILPRSGFLEGEIIPIRFEINNGSIRDVKKIDIEVQYFGQFKGYTTTCRPAYLMKECSSCKTFKHSIPIIVRFGSCCVFQHMIRIHSNSNQTINNSTILKTEFYICIKIYSQNIPHPLELRYPICISKIFVKPNSEIVENVAKADPIFRFFSPKLPRQMSMDKSGDNLREGPVQVENNLIALLERVEQNSPLDNAGM